MMEEAERRVIVHKSQVVSKVIRPLDSKAGKLLEVERGEILSELNPPYVSRALPKILL